MRFKVESRIIEQASSAMTWKSCTIAAYKRGKKNKCLRETLVVKVMEDSELLECCKKDGDELYRQYLLDKQQSSDTL